MALPGFSGLVSNSRLKTTASITLMISAMTCWSSAIHRYSTTRLFMRLSAPRSALHPRSYSRTSSTFQPAQRTPEANNRVGNIMRDLGWEKSKTIRIGGDPMRGYVREMKPAGDDPAG